MPGLGHAVAAVEDVEHPQVEEERVLGLAGERLAAAAVGRDGRVAQCGVVRHAGVADVRRCDRCVVEHQLHLVRALADRGAGQVVGLPEQQVRVLQRRDRAVVVEEGAVAGEAVGVLRHPRVAELPGVDDVRLRVVVVVDVDLVPRVGGPRVEVRAAARLLERDPVGDQVDLAVGLRERVDVGVVVLRLARDRRRLAVARCRGRGRRQCGDATSDDDRSHAEQGSRPSSASSSRLRHGSLLEGVKFPVPRRDGRHSSGYVGAFGAAARRGLVLAAGSWRGGPGSAQAVTGAGAHAASAREADAGQSQQRPDPDRGQRSAGQPAGRRPTGPAGQHRDPALRLGRVLGHRAASAAARGTGTPSRTRRRSCRPRHRGRWGCRPSSPPTTCRAMSTTSSVSRRPFGKPLRCRPR